MHADEFPIDETLVRDLVAAQFPHWTDAAIEPVDSAGTDNALYRLGDALVVRLPRIARAEGQITQEARWLPVLAPRLPLPIPTPVALGRPAATYPWHWAVYRWLEGHDAVVEPLLDPAREAMVLARFVAALRSVDPTDGPPPGAHNAHRGVPLAARDPATRKALAALVGVIDTENAGAVWQDAMAVPAWADPPRWIHGDIDARNLLVRAGRISAVIDWGCLGVGDPAYDLMAAWTLFEGASRQAFRDAVGVDDATWARGRGLALSVALIQLPYYFETNPVIAGIARRTIASVLNEVAEGS
jgi:aminoglycoside phosphotransferase (APT) family kinase protein